MTPLSADEADGDLALVAYIDESRKPLRDRRTRKVLAHGYYVVAAAVILAADSTSVRDAMVELARDLTDGKPLRWKDLAVTKRRKAIETVVALPDWDACMYETSRAVSTRHHSDARLRARALRATFIDLAVNRGIEEAILETRSEPHAGFTTHDKRDNELLQSLHDTGAVPREFRIEHRGKSEPILWLSDLLAGVRGDYRCWSDRDLYPLIAHRVIITQKFSP